MQRRIAFDIETGPIADDELRRFFDPPEPPGDFDPATVKYGRTKDEEKRQAILDKATAAHDLAVANHDTTIAAAFEELKSRSALSALTGRVLAIGYGAGDDISVTAVDDQVDERSLIAMFWATFHAAKTAGDSLVGHNIFGFDLPILVQRSIILDVGVPPGVFTFKGRWVNWNSVFADTMLAWSLGATKFAKLDDLANALNIGRKTEGVSGGDFAGLFFGSEDGRAKAIEYLRQDVRLTLAVADKVLL